MKAFTARCFPCHPPCLGRRSMENNSKQIAITIAEDEVDGVETSSQNKLISSMQMENNDTKIEIASNEVGGLETSMRKILSSLPSYSNSKCCIYRVPEFTLNKKEGFYRPKVISIGPVFYRNNNLEAMQELKWIYLDSFLKHTNNENRSLNCYINTIRELKDDIQDCYQDKGMLLSCSDDDEFIKMIVLDAVFLLCLFMSDLSNDCPVAFSPNIPIPKKLRESYHFIETDILISENQLPFFVLKRIFDLAFPSVPTSLLTDLACCQISSFNIPGGDHVGESNNIVDASHIAHLLDLFRKCCCSSLSDTPFRSRKPIKYPDTAKQLSAAGVKFKKSQSKNLLCIKFDRGELHIPSILVNKKTEAFLRNLLHFEQCHYFDEDHAYFADLFFFLDSLIDSAEDVQILQQSGILDNVLGSDDKAAQLFNNMTTDIFTLVTENHYWEVSEQVRKYANKRCNRWMAILKRDYFGHPWAIISFIFAIILFILTVIQTVTGFTKN